MKRLFIPLIQSWGKSIESHHFTDEPIYIGGCGRSGTTLLLSILSAHANIHAFPKELNPFESSSINQGIVKTPKFYRIYRSMIKGEIKKSATRYCEKSPANILHLEEISMKHNGKFKLIQIIRDGRDVILSRHPRGKNNYWVEPERWINDVSKGLEYSDDPRVYTIKYEDLVLHFNETISGICNFLELSLSEEILHWHKHATVRQNNALFSTINEINTSSIGKWKRPENAERTAEFNSHPEAVDLLSTLEYE